MSDKDGFPGFTLWRIGAGALGLVAGVVGVLRFYALVAWGVPEGTTWVGSVLRVIFPLGIGLAFAYVALAPAFWQGKGGGGGDGDGDSGPGEE